MSETPTVVEPTTTEARADVSPLPDQSTPATGIPDLETVDPAFANYLKKSADDRGEIPTTKPVVEKPTTATTPAGEKTEPAKKEVVTTAPLEKTSGKEFVFDKNKYEAQGVTEQTALKILEERDKSLFELNKLKGKQGSEVGTLRKENKEIAAELQLLQEKISALQEVTPISDDEFQELMAENPRAALVKEREMEKLSEERKKLESERTELSFKKTVMECVDNFNDIKDEIANVIRDDGSEDVARQFLQNPYQLSPAVTINIARQINASREIKGLKETIKTLQEQLKSAPSDTINRLKNVGRQTSSPAPQSETNTPSAGMYSGTLVGLMPIQDLKAEVKQNYQFQ
jgi:hypothetical protein